jgi:hypothetical protein
MFVFKIMYTTFISMEFHCKKNTRAQEVKWDTFILLDLVETYHGCTTCKLSILVSVTSMK